MGSVPLVLGGNPLFFGRGQEYDRFPDKNMRKAIQTVLLIRAFAAPSLSGTTLRDRAQRGQCAVGEEAEEGGVMASPIDINNGYQELVLRESNADFAEQLQNARDMRHEIDHKLDELAWIVSDSLTRKERIEHEARIRGLILCWMGSTPQSRA